MTEERREICDRLKAICKKRGFTKDDFAIFSFLPFSEDAVDTYGSVEVALEEAIKTAIEYDDIDTIIAEYCEKIGFN